MVDRVELAVVDQLAHVRDLDRGDAVVGEHGRDALDEAVQVGRVRHHVVRDQHRRGAVLDAEPTGDPGVEELRHGRDAERRRRGDLTRRRVDAENGDAPLDEVPQQVAVVRPPPRPRASTRPDRAPGSGSPRASARGRRTRPRTRRSRGSCRRRACAAAPPRGSARACTWGRTRRRAGSGPRCALRPRARAARRRAASRRARGRRGGRRRRTTGSGRASQPLTAAGRRLRSRSSSWPACCRARTRPSRCSRSPSSSATVIDSRVKAS